MSKIDATKWWIMGRAGAWWYRGQPPQYKHISLFPPPPERNGACTAVAALLYHQAPAVPFHQFDGIALSSSRTFRTRKPGQSKPDGRSPVSPRFSAHFPHSSFVMADARLTDDGSRSSVHKTGRSPIPLKSSRSFRTLHLSRPIPALVRLWPRHITQRKAHARRFPKRSRRLVTSTAEPALRAIFTASGESKSPRASRIHRIGLS